MMVTTKGMQPKHEKVSLIGNNMKSIRVNVKLTPRCNFLVYFYNKGDESDGELIKYMFKATNGRSNINVSHGRAGTLNFYYF